MNVIKNCLYVCIQESFIINLYKLLINIRVILFIVWLGVIEDLQVLPFVKNNKDKTYRHEGF